MSEYEQHKKDMQDLIESRKVKLSTPDGGAGTTREKYTPLKPTTFKEKWINYWYHYKGLTFGSLFAGILVFSFVWQLATKTVYDAAFLLVTELPFDSVIESFEKGLLPLTEDFTQNGKKDISIMPIQQDPEGKYEVSPELVQANFVKLSGSIASLDTFLYFVDETNYKSLKEMEIGFMDLSELVDKEKLGTTTDRYPIKGTKLAELLDVGEATDDMYICFMDYNSLDEKRQEKKDIKTKYDRDMRFLKALIKYE